MKNYTRTVHMPDPTVKKHDHYIVVKKTDKYYPKQTGAHADIIRRELLFKNFDDAVEEYLKQCDRAWSDVRYAEKHRQDTIILYEISLQGFTPTADDTFRTARYHYTCEE